jgi:hypothetical protein
MGAVGWVSWPLRSVALREPFWIPPCVGMTKRVQGLVPAGSLGVSPQLLTHISLMGFLYR